MAIDDVEWRWFYESLLAEQPPTPCGYLTALIEFIYIYTRFEKEQHR